MTNHSVLGTRSQTNSLCRKRLQVLLAECDVKLDGSEPHDIEIIDERAIHRIMQQGSLGLGESYMDGQWQCKSIDGMISRLMRHSLTQHFTNTWSSRWLTGISRLRNQQSKSRAVIVGTQHYDIGNELYEQMLDPYMNYSCGYWENASTLEQAQTNKMELICRKLDLKPGITVLDIGCGWGGMARYAAENYGVQIVGVTISKEQQSWATTHLEGLPIEIRLQDYREINETYDRLLSIGMFEHVGYKNYHDFFRKCHDVVRPDGLVLLHTIGGNVSDCSADPWMHRYIFPNGMLPSITQIGAHIEPYFVLEDWHNFGPYYDTTLVAWHQRINQSWDALNNRYDERFRRMWNYYLLACAGAFRARNMQTWQLVLSKGKSATAYQRPSLADFTPTE